MTKISRMDIHQLSVNYIREQDRVLVRINTRAGEELRFWMTRRLTRNLRPHLNATAVELDTRSVNAPVTDPGAKEMLSEFKRQETLANADFKTPYAAAPQALPLGPEPLLVTHVQIGKPDKGHVKVGLEERLGEGKEPRGFQMSLSMDLLHGLLHLLDTAVKAADWQLGEPSAGTPAVAEAAPATGGEPGKVLH